MRFVLKMVYMMALISSLAACGSTQYRGYEMPVAMREVFRGGQLKGLEDHTDPNKDLGMPAPYDMVQHTCTSQPTYNLDGSFHRTAVRCY